MNLCLTLQYFQKTGKESLTDNGKNTNYNLFDFWKWSVSDILSNATRGRFAEFVVGTAVGLNPKNLRDEWDAYDLTTDDGIKIEVKSISDTFPLIIILKIFEVSSRFKSMPLNNLFLILLIIIFYYF